MDLSDRSTLKESMLGLLSPSTLRMLDVLRICIGETKSRERIGLLPVFAMRQVVR